MKRLIFTTGLILIFCVCLSSAAERNIPAATNVEDYTVTTETQAAVYVLKSQNGRVAVFKAGESLPYITTNTLVSSLPRSDSRRLEKGIEIDGELKLKRALEDFCS